MTRPIYAVDKALEITKLAAIAHQLEYAVQDALRFHRQNPASEHTLPALLEQVDQTAQELAAWRVRVGGER